MSKPLVSVGLVLFGAIVGFLVGREFAGPRVDSPEVAPAAEVAVGPEGEPTPRPDGKPRADDGVKTATPNERPVLASVEEFVKSHPVPEPVRGDLSIEGQIRMPTGEAVEGVVVVAERSRDREWQSFQADRPPRPKGLKERIDDALDEYAFELSHRVETVSVSDGTYRLEGLVDGDYNLTAFKKGLRIDAATSSFGVAAAATVDWEAQLVVPVSVTVLTPSGEEPNEATVIATGSGRFDYTAVWRRTERIVWLPAGRFEIEAKMEDRPELRSEPQILTFVVGRVAAPLTLKLEARPRVSGRVIVPESFAFSYVTVYLLPHPGHTPTDEELLEASFSDSCHSDGNYAFSFTSLASRRYVLAVGNERIANRVEIEVSEEGLEYDIEWPPPELEDHMRLRAYAPDGTPTEIDRVQHEMGGQAVTPWEDLPLLVRKDKSYWIPKNVWPPGAKKPTARCFLVVESPFGQARVPYRFGEDDIRVEFEEPAYLTVILNDYRPTSRLSATLVGAESKALLFSHEEVSADGVAKFGALVPGRYDLRLRFVPSLQSVVELSVELRSGDNESRITLPTLHRLTIELGQRATDGVVSLFDENFSAFNFRLVSSNSVTLPGLAPGRYTLAYEATNVTEAMIVDVRSDQSVTFEPQPLRALEVVIDEAAGDLARAGLQSGDLIIGFRGREFESFDQMARTFRSWDGKVDLTIESGGQRVEAVVDADLLLSGSSGGRLIPVSR